MKSERHAPQSVTSATSSPSPTTSPASSAPPAHQPPASSSRTPELEAGGGDLLTAISSEEKRSEGLADGQENGKTRRGKKKDLRTLKDEIKWAKTKLERVLKEELAKLIPEKPLTKEQNFGLLAEDGIGGLEETVKQILNRIQTARESAEASVRNALK